MGLLLDTCAAIWLVDGDPFSIPATTALEDSRRGDLHVSPVSAWEFGMLASRGRLKWSTPPLQVYRELIERTGSSVIELTAEILVASSFLPDAPPNDPFDRIVIATALRHNLTILTRDRLILAYAKAGHVRAIAC